MVPRVIHRLPVGRHPTGNRISSRALVDPTARAAPAGPASASAGAGGGGASADSGAGAVAGTGGGGGGTWRPATVSATNTNESPSRPHTVANSHARAGRNSLPGPPEGSGRLHIASNRS